MLDVAKMELSSVLLPFESSFINVYYYGVSVCIRKSTDMGCLCFTPVSVDITISQLCQHTNMKNHYKQWICFLIIVATLGRLVLEIIAATQASHMVQNQTSIETVAVVTHKLTNHSKDITKEIELEQMRRVKHIRLEVVFSLHFKMCCICFSDICSEWKDAKRAIKQVIFSS